MNRAVLIFTFSPIQPFIAEGRRPADAYAGSRILSNLAVAAGTVLYSRGQLIYPASLAGDAPNKLVALVDIGKAEDIGKTAGEALIHHWKNIAKEARISFERKTTGSSLPVTDMEWQRIWERQVDPFPWEIFWVAQPMDDGLPAPEDYRQAYDQAEKALNALKRLRAFEQATPEIGQKDSLSGSRQGLQTAFEKNSSTYWTRIGDLPKVTPAELRPGERLDAIGLVKRFWETGFGMQMDGEYVAFPSTSSIASHLYLHRLEEHFPTELATYRSAIQPLEPFGVRKGGPWPYDGDYFYPDSLLELAKKAPPESLIAAKQALERLHKKAGRPPTYYAILAMDGDSMGEKINQAISADDPIQAHKNLSASLSSFSTNAKTILIEYHAFPVYLGGDDLLFFAPLETALEASHELATAFTKMVKTSISAGMAIVHHTFPLNAALRAVHQVEGIAKKYQAAGNEKNAVCVRALKRSGETLQVCAHWEDLPNYVWEMLSWFRNDQLSTRMAYEANRSAYYLPASGPMVQAELYRLLLRHRDELCTHPIDAGQWAQRLNAWAAVHPGGLNEVSDWLLLARFLAKGETE